MWWRLTELRVGLGLSRRGHGPSGGHSMRGPEFFEEHLGGKMGIDLTHTLEEFGFELLSYAKFLFSHT